MARQAVKLQCQRIGCDARFTEDDNPEGSCRYHDAAPFFHDGMKEWSCCKKRSHDFSLFLEIPGCKSGKHTTEKPILTKAIRSSSNSTPAPVSTAAPAVDKSSREACSRCRQGFFCSDHGSQVKDPNVKSSNTAASDNVEGNKVPAPPQKIIDINTPQICGNKGCGKSFKERDNHDVACEYHPGPAVFHDRMRGWKCCDVHVKDFDEFMSIPPCTKGWHKADP